MGDPRTEVSRTSLVRVVVFALPISVAIGCFLGYRGGKDRALADSALDGTARQRGGASSVTTERGA